MARFAALTLLLPLYVHMHARFRFPSLSEAATERRRIQLDAYVQELQRHGDGRVSVLLRAFVQPDSSSHHRGPN